jgi:glycosyltransferase involved in cell wall biosynthesis
MRILLVGDYPADPRLGSAKVYYKLRESLRALGHDCEVMLAPELGERPAQSRVRWAVGPWVAARAVVRAFRERGPFDVIDVASAEALGVAAARTAALLPGASVVARSHGLEHRNYLRMLDDARLGLARKPWARRWWYPLARLSQVAAGARAADALIVLNDADAHFALERGWRPRERVHVVPHGGAEAAAAGPEGSRGAGLLFCGSWDAVKGIPYLVEAFARLRPPARLTVLGPGPDADEVLAAFPEAVRPRVRVLPRADEAEVLRHFREHDALVHPSTFEGFGMAVVEAMSQGLPVIATPVGCAAALVRAGETGWRVPPRDPAALAAAMEDALADPAAARRMGAAARDAVRGMTWEAAARRTVEVYEAVRR